MTRKKIIFVIAEGPSDETALGAILQNIYDINQVHIEVVHGDITTESGVAPHNILSKIGAMVTEHIKQNRYLKKADFEKIIHIVDMDGAYIHDENIVEDTSLKETLYCTTKIITNSKTNIINRNRQKTANLNKICSCHEIGKKEKIPYRVFYMSCNLDHVLYDKINSTDSEKKHNSINFAKRYKENIQEFLSFISESDFSVNMLYKQSLNPYKESWDFIKQGLHSLERHTNFGICFNTISYCGLDCEKCDAYIATKNNDDVLREKTAKLWSELNHTTILPEHINCSGCRSDGVKTVFCESICDVRKCAMPKGFTTCGDCPEMKKCPILGAITANNPDVLKNLKKLRGSN